MQEVSIDDVNPELVVTDEYVVSLFQENKVEVTFLFRSFFTNTKILREIILKILDKAWIPQLWQNRFMLIVDELNNNAIEYGSADGDLNQMRVYVEKFEEWKSQIIIEVQDTGKWNFAKSAEEMLALKEMKMEEWFDNHKSIRGRGLFMIILKLADELYFKDAPNGWLIVWVKKNLSI